jgi:hypothetical protein
LQLLQVAIAAVAGTVKNYCCHDAEANQGIVIVYLEGTPAGLMIATQLFGVAGTIPTRQMLYSCVTQPGKDHQTCTIHYSDLVNHSVGKAGSLVSLAGSNTYDSWCHLATTTVILNPSF